MGGGRCERRTKAATCAVTSAYTNSRIEPCSSHHTCESANMVGCAGVRGARSRSAAKAKRAERKVASCGREENNHFGMLGIEARPPIVGLVRVVVNW